MASERETIAEIEAILRGRLRNACVDRHAGLPVMKIDGIPEAAAAIAALRAQDREDGAREMRERAEAICDKLRERHTDDNDPWDAGYQMACITCGDQISDLPLSPARTGDGRDA